MALPAQTQGHGGAKISPGEKNQEPHLKKKKKPFHHFFQANHEVCTFKDLTQNEEVD